MGAGASQPPSGAGAEGYCNGPFCDIKGAFGCGEHGVLSGAAGHLEDIVRFHTRGRRDRVPVLWEGRVDAYRDQRAEYPLGSALITQPLAANFTNLDLLERVAARGHRATWYVIWARAADRGARGAGGGRAARRPPPAADPGEALSEEHLGFRDRFTPNCSSCAAGVRGRAGGDAGSGELLSAGAGIARPLVIESRVEADAIAALNGS